MSPFLDTNVLVYAFEEDDRSEQAQDLLASPFVIGVQTLNEFSNVLNHRRNRSWEEIVESSQALRNLADTVLDTTVADHVTALVFASRYRLSIYDSLMLASALRGGCITFYSEDMHHGLVIEDRMTILNPFR